MFKDFWKWHKKKELVHEAGGTALFHEREVWWCTLGTNIGFEQDGSGELFTRPVVILTKFNLDACLIVPLTAKPKKGKYYYSFMIEEGQSSTANLSQIRLIDSKRLQYKIGVMHKRDFVEVKEKLRQLLV